MQPTLYIAFLRAINVGGHTVKMDRLRELFTEIGFANVRTFIQSGNVFFESPESDPQKLVQKIEAHLSKALGYEVPTIIRTVKQLEQAIALDPFKKIEVTPDIRLCIMFTRGPMTGLELPYVSQKKDLEILRATEGEAFVIIRIIDGRVPNGSAVLEKLYGVKATTRFYETTKRLLVAAKA